MNKDFKRFKKRVWRDVFIKCGVAGLAAGFFAAAVVLLALRLSQINLLWVFYVLIAVGGCAVGFGVSFLLLRTDDRKIAKRLDAELGLKERTQTALYYLGESGDMIEQQRKDMSAALSFIPTKMLPFNNLAVTIALACVFAFSAGALPIIMSTVRADDRPTAATTEPVRQVTEWEWQALDDLIAYVKASKKADSYLKTGTVTQLEDLRALLVAGVSQSSLTSFVRNTANEIRNIVTDANDRAATDEQKSLNTEEGNYIVNRLYEIFSLIPEGEGGGEEEDPNGSGGDDEKEDPNGGGGTGTGKLNVDDTPFFDPEKGYVKLGEVRDEYYAKVQQALIEGVISKEEWEYIVSTYFSDLTAKEDQP